MAEGGTREGIYSALIQIVTQWSTDDLQRHVAESVGVNLDASQVRALYLLGQAGGSLGNGRLAEATHMSAPTTSKLVSRLEVDGLAERVRAGRTVEVRLTESGLHAYKHLVDAGKHLVNDAVAEWDAHDLEDFGSQIVRFAHTLTSPKQP